MEIHYSHINDLDRGPSNKTQLFGVFDGHGWNEEAKFVQNHFSEEFLKALNYLNNDPKKALKESFKKIDQLMLEKDGVEELLSLFKKSKEEESKIKENNRNAQIEMILEVIDSKEQDDAKISMFTGCTGNVLVVQDKNYCLHGDSLGALCKKGTVIPISIDHKPSIPAELKQLKRQEDGPLIGEFSEIWIYLEV